jgi:hypothetical protein
VNRFSTIALGFAVCAALPGFADDGGLQRCRAIKDSAQRLSCYDALPLGAPAPAMAPAAPSSPAAAAAAPAAAAAAPPTAAVASAPAAVPPPSSRFGFELRALPDELAYLESYIPGTFEGWKPRSRITLANGQVWQVIDESSRMTSRENPKVKVTRGMIGSFFLEIEGINPAPRVRRVQ